MKTIKTLSFFFSIIFVVLFFEAHSFDVSKADVTEAINKDNCDITINFCIEGGGAGHYIDLYADDNCAKGWIATLGPTNLAGCVSYTFLKGCNQVHTVIPVCTTPLAQCRYFYPVNIGNNGTFQVAKCP